MTSKSTINKHRRKELFDRLKFLADLACESHDRQHLGQVFEVVLKLMRVTATEKSIKELADILVHCVNDGDTVAMYKERPRDVYVNGSIDVDEFAKHVVWVHTHIEELGA